jgi:hypothetical protein
METIRIKQVLLQNYLLKMKVLCILEKKEVLSVEEYELYLYLCNLQEKKEYPILPDSDSEGEND